MKASRKTLLENYKRQLKILLENDLSRAETILSIKYLNEELVKQSENISELLGKNILVISDQLSKEWDREVSKKFSDTVAKSLNGVLEQIRNTRNEINNFLSYLEGDSTVLSDENINTDMEEKEILSDIENEMESPGEDEDFDFDAEKDEPNMDKKEEKEDIKQKKVAVDTVVSSRKRR